MHQFDKDVENIRSQNSQYIDESERIKRLNEFRKPIIDEVMAENPGLSKEQLIKMMDEMGF